ncbi:MAG: carbohydrate kinase family protein [Hyphomicrobiales bacterium]|nr:carbohydrate kinase family protein [Hyphomicrobiales bacterium]
MSQRRGIICGGSWCVDRNKLIDHWPEQENIAVIVSEERQGGGNGANGCVDLKRLGAPFPVEAIGLVGDDEDGRLLLGLCTGNGVDANLMSVTDEAPTAYTDVMTDRKTGKRTFFYYAGCHALLSPDHFDLTHTNAAILHLGLPGTLATMDGPWGADPSGWVTVARNARAAGLKTNLELCPVPAERNAALGRPILPFLDYLVINDAEAGALAGLATVVDGVAEVEACEQAALTIIEKSSAELIVVHFPHGAVAVDRDLSPIRRPSVRVPPEAIKGSNGAGDAFASGMLIGIHENWPLVESLALASASAAASLRAVTTTGAVENWKECLALADQWGWRDAF